MEQINSIKDKQTWSKLTQQKKTFYVPPLTHKETKEPDRLKVLVNQLATVDDIFCSSMVLSMLSIKACHYCYRKAFNLLSLDITNTID